MGGVSWYKLVVFSTTFWQEGSILLQKYRDRNGRCIAILFRKYQGQGPIRFSWTHTDNFFYSELSFVAVDGFCTSPWQNYAQKSELFAKSNDLPSHAVEGCWRFCLCRLCRDFARGLYQGVFLHKPGEQIRWPSPGRESPVTHTCENPRKACAAKNWP